jgi:hypothetical protein
MQNFACIYFLSAYQSFPGGKIQENQQNPHRGSFFNHAAPLVPPQPLWVALPGTLFFEVTARRPPETAAVATSGDEALQDHTTL